MRSRYLITGLIAMLLILGFPAAAAAQGEAPGQPSRLAGEISSIQGTTITLETISGQSQRIKVEHDTSFRSIGGQIQGVDDLEVGMHVVVLGSKQGEIVFARLLAVATDDQLNRFHRVRGQVVGIDAADQSFVVETRDDERFTFETNEDTKYHSRGEALGEFGDLALGQRLTVISSADEPGIARRVLLLPEFDGERPSVDIKVRGELVALSASSLTVETPEGERVMFLISENTRLKRIGPDSLQIGDKVLVAGFESEQGRNIAVLVLARPALNRDLGDRSPDRQAPAPLPGGLERPNDL